MNIREWLADLIGVVCIFGAGYGLLVLLHGVGF